MKITNKPLNYKRIDSTVSRSAQPEISNLCWLKKQGVTDIINFRTMIAPSLNFNEEQTVQKLKMNYHNIPSISKLPNSKNVGKFLNIIDDVKKRNGRVHIHCKQGADRTGMYAYIYERLNNIGTEGSRIIELFKHGYHFERYPKLIDWAMNFVKQVKK